MRWNAIPYVPKPHWTPRYLVHRLRSALWERRNPDAPWLVPDAIPVLERALRPGHLVVEFGSGRSTVWFARRVRRVVSVEHDAPWHRRVSALLDGAGLVNVDYRLVSAEPGAYVGAADTALGGERPDVVLVDGEARSACALWALDHLAPGGVLVVDNANWYLPSATDAPSSVGEQGSPKTPEWADFWRRVAASRRQWFSNGVSDTLVITI